MNDVLELALALALTPPPSTTETGPEEAEAFTGWSPAQAGLQERVFRCNGERYVVTLDRYRVTQVRTPWGLISDDDLTAVRRASEQLRAVGNVFIHCRPAEFRLDLSGPPVEAEASVRERNVSLLFRHGSLVEDQSEGR